MAKMLFSDFQNEIVAKIKDYLPESFNNSEVSLQIVQKNNLELTGIVIRSISSVVTPTIYLDNFYSQYESGEEIGEILRKIAELRINHEFENEFDIESITSWNRCKERIIPKLVGVENNRDFLKERPYTEIADLAVVYCILLEESSDGSMTVPITNQLMSSWEVSVDEIHEVAITNMLTLTPTSFRSMAQVMQEMMGLSDEEMEEMGMASGEQMYILTNKQKLNGASALLDSKMMEAIYERIGEFYILPSSTHEVIVCSFSNRMDVEDLRTMVKEVNDTQVAPEDLLSYSVYSYNPVDGVYVAS